MRFVYSYCKMVFIVLVLTKLSRSDRRIMLTIGTLGRVVVVIPRKCINLAAFILY